jgi:hypothetical protein
MKIQLFALAGLTSLACATAASAETIVNTNVKPIVVIDVNTAVNNRLGGVQGGTQLINAVQPQGAAIVTAPSTPATTQIINGYKVDVPGVSAPNVIVNTSVTPTVAVQANTAVQSANLTQGGGQTTIVSKPQNGLVSGRGADGAYIYNYTYDVHYQKMYNNAYYSTDIKQGGDQKIITESKATGSNAAAAPTATTGAAVPKAASVVAPQPAPTPKENRNSTETISSEENGTTVNKTVNGVK